jgi:hypothetical protein
MIHFFIVFFSVYFCLAVNAVLIFGQDIEDYCDMTRSVLTCFRCLFGDWDWAAMDEGTMYLSKLWFWIFVMVMTVLLLNFLLAILMDKYSIVNGSAKEEEDLLAQIDTMMRRRIQSKAKERVKLNAIFNEYFKDVGDEKELLASSEYVTAEDITEKVPGIPKSQASRTLGQAKKNNTEPPADYGLTDVKSDMDVLNDRTRYVRDSAEHIRTIVSKYDSRVTWNYKITCHEVEKPVPPRQQIISTVRDEIVQIEPSISGVMAEEIEGFELQHRDLLSHNKNMQAQLHDARYVMETIRQHTETIRQNSHRQAILERRVPVSLRGKAAHGYAPATESAPRIAR